jgi:hypothetical protein
MALSFLTSAADGSKRSASRPGRFAPEERNPDTHCIGCWVVPRAGRDAVKKRNVSYRESNQPVTLSIELFRLHTFRWADRRKQQIPHTGQLFSPFKI